MPPAELTTGPYKGYRGLARYDADGADYHGRVSGIRDIVTFVGRDPAELEGAFRDSVDDYLAFCDSRKEQPCAP